MTDKLDIDAHAFPYLPPSEQVKERYSEFFDNPSPIQMPKCKRAFDIALATIVLIPGVFILLILKVFIVLEGLLNKEARGPLLYFYWGVSQGRKFRKWKIRAIKNAYIDPEKSKLHEWAAYKNEWIPE